MAVRVTSTFPPSTPENQTPPLVKLSSSGFEYGIGHNLQEHYVVLIRGGRVKDLLRCTSSLKKNKRD